MGRERAGGLPTGQPASRSLAGPAASVTDALAAVLFLLPCGALGALEVTVATATKSTAGPAGPGFWGLARFVAEARGFARRAREAAHLAGLALRLAWDASPPLMAGLLALVVLETAFPG